MQEEVNEKVIALSIKTGKLSAEVLQKSMKFFLSQVKKQANKRQMPHGRQTLKQLMKQNAGVSNIEITKDNSPVAVYSKAGGRENRPADREARYREGREARYRGKGNQGTRLQGSIRL